MKVLLISHYPPPAGGIASWTKRLLAVGLPNGWDISHINLNTTNGRDPFKNTKRNFKDEYERSMNIWKQEIEKLKTEEDISVVHTCIPCTVFGMMRETITGMIAKRYKKKFILHCRCTVPNVVNSGLKRIFFKVLAHFCDGIMVLNQKSFDFATKYSKSKVVLIPNFVTNAEIQEIEGREFSERLVNVMYVGGVTPEKGCDTIVEAAKHLPDMKFHMIGIVSEEIEKMEHSSNMVFYGNCEKERVKELLKDGDVFLFLSRYWGEGFSNALAEAMAAGMPCIVTDWAANADMVEDKGGIVIPPQEVNALVDALKYYDFNPEERKTASVWNVDKVKRAYAEDVILNEYTKFYSELTGEGVLN